MTNSLREKILESWGKPSCQSFWLPDSSITLMESTAISKASWTMLVIKASGSLAQ